ncbi:MAG: type III-B CRISPR module-associated protein Cmr5 [Rhodothermia bacterium]|nr:type III-B CRISPR module-associated protein Cmr5 [Rhodothermia bacterium]
MSSTIPTLERGRATAAYSAVYKIKDRGKVSKEYKSYAKKLPMMIKTNGLGPALTFAWSKGSNKTESAWGLLFSHIREWLTHSQNKHLVPQYQPGQEFIQYLIGLNSFEYRAIAIEVLAYLGWVKRFVDGLIEGEADDL